MRNKILQIWTNRQRDNIDVKQISMTLIGASLAILILSFAYPLTGFNILLAPFGATCVLLFALPDSPLAQPKNIIFGHLITACIGLLFFHFFGFTPLSVALSVGVAIAAMRLTSTIHPPAGANPIVIMVGSTSWDFLEFVALGSVVLVVCGVLFHRLSGKMYPKYWL
ncbi:MAG: HPP family protein [Campylobacterales bacterium]|nr:HPP family protein [Campylobacterales bacterium]